MSKKPRKRVHISQETYNEAALFAKLNGLGSVDALMEHVFNQWLDMTSANPDEVLNPPGPNDPVEMTIQLTYDTREFLKELAIRSGHPAGTILERAFRKQVDTGNKKRMEEAKPPEFKLPLKTYDA